MKGSGVRVPASALGAWSSNRHDGSIRRTLSLVEWVPVDGGVRGDLGGGALALGFERPVRSRKPESRSEEWAISRRRARGSPPV